MSTPASEPDESFEALAKRIAKLPTSRESLVDPLGVAHVIRLFERARALPEPSRDAVAARVRASLVSLGERVAGLHARATRRIDELAAEGDDVSGLRSELARGGTSAIEYRYRRRVRLGRDLRKVDPSVEARLASLARSMGVDFDPSRPHALFEVASKLYDRSASDAIAALLFDRLPDGTNEDAGRYHTETVVASILRAMHDASPTYLRAMLARLDMAAELRHFLRGFETIAPPPAPKAERARRPRGKKKG